MNRYTFFVVVRRKLATHMPPDYSAWVQASSFKLAARHGLARIGGGDAEAIFVNSVELGEGRTFFHCTLDTRGFRFGSLSS